MLLWFSFGIQSSSCFLLKSFSLACFIALIFTCPYSLPSAQHTTESMQIDKMKCEHTRLYEYPAAHT